MTCFFVPGAGIEPAQPCGYWCLRPARLPIPPSGQLFGKLWSAKIAKLRSPAKNISC